MSEAFPQATHPAMAPQEAILRLQSVTRVYRQGTNDLLVFRDVSLAVRPGEIVALVGPSGAGKSSLLHIAGLLEAPSAGEVYIAGVAATRLREKDRTRLRRDTLGFVYQFHHLLPEFTALENVALPQMIAGRSWHDAAKEAERLLSMVGLAQRLEHRPSKLSGGEQQRVAIARALANHPRVVLADEPTGNLDPKTAGQVFQVLLDMARAANLSALVATHNIELATKLDRTLLLHDGRLIDGGRIQRQA
ncbi:MAG: ABC transporter ATP-binding protein [Alphaproteobacteria bacterium]